jgi:hypothetical protein
MVKIGGHEIQEILANVAGEYVFYLNDGRILRNVAELKDALNTMSDELYAYHVNSEKNDFNNWVKDIICDEKLAHDLLKARDRAAAAKVTTQRLAFLIGKMK